MTRRHIRLLIGILLLLALAVAGIRIAPALRSLTPGHVLRLFEQHGAARTLTIRAPLDGTLFPPDIAAPAFRWDDPGGSDTWLVAVGDDAERRVSGLLSAPEWTPTEVQWAAVKAASAERDVPVVVLGLKRSERQRGLAVGRIGIRTSADPVGAPIFYREVNLPFAEAVTDPSRIRWRFGPVSSAEQPPVVLENLPVCGNCHSFSSDGAVLGMDVDYANDKGSYAIAGVEPEIVLDDAKIITWSDYRREDGELTFGLLSQVSPDGRYVVSTVKDRSVFVPRPDLEFSQLFFPVKGILAIYDRREKTFHALPGADDPVFVQSNATWSPDGAHIVFARAKAHELKGVGRAALLTYDQCREFLEGERGFQFDLYRIPFNGGKGGKAVPVPGASDNGMSNFFPKFSPDGKWIVFCRARNFMLLQPDSELYIMSATGGEARRLRCNTGRMNSWHSWSPNGRWLVFSSKANGPYTQLFLTHIDGDGLSTPPVLLDRFTSPDRAANIPEFLAAGPEAIRTIRERFVDDKSVARAAEAFLRGGDLAKAREGYRKAIRMNPENADAHHDLGAVLMKTGDMDRGMHHLRRALAIDPTMAKAYTNLGAALARQGRFAEAEAHFVKAIELAPEDMWAHLLFARLLAVTGKPEEAIRSWRRAIELAPDWPVPRMELAAAYAGAGRFDDAVAAATKALGLARAKRAALVPEIERRLEAYRAKKPRRQEP